MKKLLTDKRFWAALALAATIVLAAVGVKVPPAIVTAVQAVIAAMPDGPDDPLDQPATHDDASEQPEPVTAEGTPPPSTGEGESQPGAAVPHSEPTTNPPSPGYGATGDQKPTTSTEGAE